MNFALANNTDARQLRLMETDNVNSNQTKDLLVYF